MLRTISLLVLTLFSPPSALLATGEGSWTVARPEAPIAGAEDVLETVWSTSRPPGGEHDRIRVHRYRRPQGNEAALLYLPGTNMNGHLASVDERYSLWLYLARRGVEVFALDYRSQTVPAEGVEDFSFMKGWTVGTYVGDIDAAAGLAEHESGRDELFVAGFSRGVTLAYAWAAVAGEERVAGLVALDGAFKDHDPQEKTTSAEAIERAKKGSSFALDVAAGIGWRPRHELMAATVAHPNGPASDDAFPNIGEQLAHILYEAWRPGGLANAKEGLSQPEVLAALLDTYDRYYPSVQNGESLAMADWSDDPSTELDDAWGEWSIPVLYFGATGMGPEWILDGVYSAVKSGSRDVELHVLERHGHLDVLVGERSEELVFEPTHAWIVERLP